MTRREGIASALRAVVLSALHSSLARLTEGVQQQREQGEPDLRVTLNTITLEQKRIGDELTGDLAQLVEDAAAYRDAIACMPTSAGAAFLALATVQQGLEEARLDHAAIANEIVELTDLSGVIRRQCGADIQREHLAANVGVANAKPIADTTLDKQAGDHPTYRAHRELLATRTKEERLAAVHVEIMAKRYATAHMHTLGFMYGVRPFAEAGSTE